MKFHWAVLIGLALVTLAVADDAQPYAGEVTASKLQLRAGPSEAYQPVVTLDEGDRVVVLGKHANSPEWICVEVPQGYFGWVSGHFLAAKPDGSATVTADRVLVRPRATTKYHHLNGRLDKGEVVRVEETKQTDEGTWMRIVVPRRFPLYAHGDYVRNVGPAALAEVKETAPAGAAATVPATTASTGADERFEALVAEVQPKLASAQTTAEVEPLRRAVEGFDSAGLSIQNHNRRLTLLGAIGKAEREAAIREITSKTAEIDAELERKLKEIERRYEERLREIREEANRTRRPRFTATGIVRERPDLFGRYPSFRIEEAGHMRYFLIATEYDLAKFAGKRVGVTGLVNPESGTGYETVIVTRIEILGDE